MQALGGGSQAGGMRQYGRAGSPVHSDGSFDHLAFA